MTTVNDIIAFANTLWPAADSEQWDAPGLAVGDPNTDVSSVLFAVDVTSDTIADAAGSQLLITHHPLLLRPTPYLNTATNKGALVTALLQNGTAQFAAHTNADSANNGTNWAIAKLLELQGTAPLEPLQRDDTLGIGRVGELPTPLPLRKLVATLADVLPATARGIAVSGDLDRMVTRVALCSGAGDSLLSNPQVDAADVYISGDLRHHPASDFIESRSGHPRPALIDLSHWASEWLWLPKAARVFGAHFPDVTFRVSTVKTDPWTVAVPTKVEPTDLVARLSEL